ncbi:hypothetical protein K474DRAFT_1713771 [Panus rudis PR-1116 ss-1]|nr:hypothetical protein K474DRAFT_1713771 [Panus rudis PR-1116 ss-1]
MKGEKKEIGRLHQERSTPALSHISSSRPTQLPRAQTSTSPASFPPNHDDDLDDVQDSDDPPLSPTMSARRQPSTTSLSKFARGSPYEFANRSLDFCNAFWGLGDGGVDVLLARMRGATRTIEELRNFWKERAMIEEQYAKRLNSLAKFTLGRDEIGELRNSLDTLRLETDKQAGFHAAVAQQIKTELEAPTNAFLSKQLHHKKTYQAAIEKEFKTKQTQEGYVNKAREKYEADCVRINSYTAQSTLMQGRDLDKIQLKLERAQQTVHANERDYHNFTRALRDTMAKWEMDWKAFCDSCQDLEEERVEFMKDNMWGYANIVSTVCVQDDESCERMRLALEQLEPEKDMENFVRDYGTGNAIPDPPQLVNYADPSAIPPSSQRPATHPANFTRATQRTRAPAAAAPPEPEEEPINLTGVGSGGGRRADSISDAQSHSGRARSQSRASTRQPYNPPPPDAGPHVNGAGPGPGPGPSSRQPDPHAEPIAPTATTMLKIGDRAYQVDVNNDPQARPNGAGAAAVGPSNVGREDDPLARQMDQLFSSAQSSGGSIRRQQQQQPPASSAPEPAGSSSRNGTNLSPPPGSRGGGPPNRDYRRSAEFVVGGPPPGAPPSRPTSPRAPTPVHMQPPSNQTPADVQQVLANYQQSLPGERKSISRPPSQASYTSPPQNMQQNRPMSGGGDNQAGVGAQGRSPSPQPFRPPSRGASPAQPSPQHAQSPTNRRNSYQRAPVNGVSPGTHNPRQNSISVPQMPAHQQRPTSPNSVGIALAPDGRVAMDSMADMYMQQQQKAQQQQQPPPNPYGRAPPPQMQPPVQQAPPPAPVPAPMAQHLPPQHGHMGSMHRSPSYPPPAQPPYGAPPPAPSGYPPNYVQQAPPTQSYMSQPVPPQPQQPQRGGTIPPPAQYQPPAHVYHPQSQADYGAPPPPPAAAGAVGGLPPPAGYYGNGQVVPQQQQQQQLQQPMGGYGSAGLGRAPSRGPSPQPPRGAGPGANQQAPPTGAYTEDGRGILFYVKAMYDYQATIDEEFDFQAGDIIAVTDTPEDGWWSGELLDEARRQPGRTVFPSNFVCLF